jgi:hypothetical protein
VPSGSPVPLIPQRMRNFDEVAKGLNGFVNLWDTMANKDISREYRSWYKPLSYSWKAVRSSMASQISVTKTLQNGFWPTLRFGRAIEIEFLDDNIVYEEYAKMSHLWDVGAIVHAIISCWLQCIYWVLLCGAFRKWQFAPILECLGSNQSEPRPWLPQSDSDVVLNA